MNATQAYALSKAYTKATVEGAGAVKGAPCTVQSIEEIEGGNRVTFAWEKTTGEIVTESMDVMDGEKGDTGVGIQRIHQVNDTIIIYYTDGTISVPIVIPTIKGDPGFSPEITVAQSTSSVYKLHIKTEDDEFDTPNLKGGGSGGTSDYEDLENKPTINGVVLVGNKTSEDLHISGNNFEVDENSVLHITGGSGGGGSDFGIYFNDVEQRKDLNNNYNLNEADPTVPEWAKNETKPTYTAEEVGAVGDNDEMPFESIDTLFENVFG